MFYQASIDVIMITVIIKEQLMKVTFFGTTTLLFDDGRDQILFDCHFTRPSLAKYIGGSEQTDTVLADRMLKLLSGDTSPAEHEICLGFELVLRGSG